MILALTDKQAGSKWRNYLTFEEITVQIFYIAGVIEGSRKEK